MEHFWPRTLKLMKEKHCHLCELDHIMANIQKYSNIRKQQNLALLNATKCNPTGLHGVRAVSHMGDVQQ